ncbi:hypothetical protein [Phreatobacter stygius]|uniref:Uncharacterized protein n=1 Tax=Phreatobacter stygius TaxID=1940610 RepID=A0A4D7B4Y3_9HYPH|nr:hypothetical protein [Phreatobacter stygius]QCI65140.1 hypothetical protein E8M01_13500 [Phreatobacter stygius]
MGKAQLDMFSGQDDLFPVAPTSYRADPDRVRRRLERILAELKAAGSMPWDTEKRRYHQTVVPQMTLWLPEGEAAQFRLVFDTEMARLGEV